MSDEIWKDEVKVRVDGCSAVITLKPELLKALGVGRGDMVQTLWKPGSKHIIIRKKPDRCKALYWDGKEEHACGNEDENHAGDHKCGEKGCDISWKRTAPNPEIDSRFDLDREMFGRDIH